MSLTRFEMPNYVILIPFIYLLAFSLPKPALVFLNIAWHRIHNTQHGLYLYASPIHERYLNKQRIFSDIIKCNWRSKAKITYNYIHLEVVSLSITSLFPPLKLKVTYSFQKPIYLIFSRKWARQMVLFVKWCVCIVKSMKLFIFIETPFTSFDKVLKLRILQMRHEQEFLYTQDNACKTNVHLIPRHFFFVRSTWY